MSNDRGFVMGVVLIAILALSLAGATAVLLSSSEVDMTGALRNKHQLEVCAESGVEVAAANLPTPANAPAAWAIDPQTAGVKSFQTKAEHIDTIARGVTGLTQGSSALDADAAAAIMANARVGSSIANSGGGSLRSPNAPAAGSSTSLQVFRLLSTCEQKSTASRMEAEGVYVYNPN